MSKCYSATLLRGTKSFLAVLHTIMVFEITIEISVNALLFPV